MNLKSSILTTRLLIQGGEERWYGEIAFPGNQAIFILKVLHCVPKVIQKIQTKRRKPGTKNPETNLF